jgi:hypothetical protein
MSPLILNAWDVLLLFLIPVGGGIPAGVLLAKNRGISWPVTGGLYLISDLILACLFEPLMLLLIALGRRWAFFSKVGRAFRQSIEKATAAYGNSLGALSLILVAFGVDPMTGRAAAAAAGHGFVTGWALSITGDMLYFFVLMASTLWLNQALGDETRTTVIILLGMIFIPAIIRRIRERKRGPA